MKKINKFKILVFDYHVKNLPHSRLGQSLSNMLTEFDNDVSKEISHTRYDCFYDDKIVPDTLKYLEERW